MRLRKPEFCGENKMCSYHVNCILVNMPRIENCFALFSTGHYDLNLFLKLFLKIIYF